MGDGQRKLGLPEKLEKGVGSVGGGRSCRLASARLELGSAIDGSIDGMEDTRMTSGER